jgi:hypothetical protein
MRSDSSCLHRNPTSSLFFVIFDLQSLHTLCQICLLLALVQFHLNILIITRPFKLKWWTLMNGFLHSHFWNPFKIFTGGPVLFEFLWFIHHDCIYIGMLEYSIVCASLNPTTIWNERMFPRGHGTLFFSILSLCLFVVGSTHIMTSIQFASSTDGLVANEIFFFFSLFLCDIITLTKWALGYQHFGKLYSNFFVIQ